MCISLASIYLGYRLFILGVSGKASLIIDANSFSGQLVNASPGLFFAIGGLIANIIISWKGTKYLYDSSAATPFIPHE